MKRIILMLLLIVGLAISGCSDNKAQELYETAQFEELQDNEDHARQLYQEIVKEHPDSKYAQNAQERLSVLQKSGDVGGGHDH
ncbi:MAG: hypothetical protein ABIF87_02885 [Pseudomonadota bacterium]